MIVVNNNNNNNNNNNKNYSLESIAMEKVAQKNNRHQGQWQCAHHTTDYHHMLRCAATLHLKTLLQKRTLDFY